MSETRDRRRVAAGDKMVPLAARLFNYKNPSFSRSSKLHRERGLLCSTGLCPNCMMEVDGVPNVRVCEFRMEASRVRIQNTTPFDRLGILSRLHGFIGVGFQYRMMYSGRRRKQLFYGILKRASGLGAAVSLAKTTRPPTQRLSPSVLVVGGGTSGLSAALEASKKKDVLLVDSGLGLGGDVYACYAGSGLAEVEVSVAKLAEMIEAVKANERITVLPRTRVIAYYHRERSFIAVSEAATYEINTDNVVVATGSHEVLPLFTNNDHPRVLLSFSAQSLLQSGADIGRRAIVVDVNGDGALVAADLVKRDLKVSLLAFPTEPTEVSRLLAEKYHVPVATNTFAVKASASGLELTDGKKNWEESADMIVVCGRRQPNYELAVMLGCKLKFEAEGSTGINSSLEGEPPLRVAVAGSLAGNESFESCLNDGRNAGVAATDGGSTSREVAIKLDMDPYLRRAMTTPPPEAYVCLCEDVTLKETLETIKEGYDNVEMLKRFTGALTGPCQGKQCALTVASILMTTGLRGAESSPFTTTRAPIASVSFAQMATGD